MRAEDHGVAERTRLCSLAALGTVDVAHDEDIVGAFERGGTLLDVIEVAAENRVIRRDLVVDAHHALAVVIVEWHRESNLTAWISRRRNPSGADDLDGCGTEDRGIDTVVDKRGAQRDLPAVVAGWRCSGGEVTGHHRRRRHKREVVVRHLTRARTLVGAEEKELVSDHRSTQRSAELISVQTVLLLLSVRSDWGEVVRCVEPAVAEEFEAVTVETV